MTMQELVQEYNTLTGESVKRFATIEDGMKRLEKAKARLAKFSKRDTRDQAMSAKIRTTWDRPEVARARRGRVGVIVNGVQYKSLMKAFKGLGIEKPVGAVRMRARLRKDGKSIYVHEGTTYVFTAVVKEAS